MFEETNSAPISFLEEPLPIEKLLQNGQVSFSIRNDNNEIEEDTDVNLVYSFDDLQPYSLKDNLDPPSDEDENDNVDVTSKCFAYYRKRMVDVTEDGKVKKLLEKLGSGPMVPRDAEKWCVYVHYAAYAEYEEYAFDITYLRTKKPPRFILGSKEIVKGFEIAVRSMNVGEKSKFIIHPDLAWGKIGVPPRIPSNAHILFEIELIDSCSTLDVKDEQVPRTFKENLKDARKFCERGNVIKKNEKNYGAAIASYRKGVELLLSLKYANATEEKEAATELLRLYTNLAVCYLLKNDYKKVCIAFNDARRVCPDIYKNKAKLFYTSGKALRHLGDHSEALKRMNTASKLEPCHPGIIQELTILDTAIEKSRKDEINICRRMFGVIKIEEKDADDEMLEEVLNSVSPGFKEDFNCFMDEFLKCNKKTGELCGNYTNAEIDFMVITARKKKLEVRKNKNESQCRLFLIKHALLTHP